MAGAGAPPCYAAVCRTHGEAPRLSGAPEVARRGTVPRRPLHGAGGESRSRTAATLAPRRRDPGGASPKLATGRAREDCQPSPRVANDPAPEGPNPWAAARPITRA